MKSDSNNGYLRATVIIEQNEVPGDGQESPATSPLQVTYGPCGNATTTVLHHPGNRPIGGITRATSITRRRGGSTNRQQLLVVLAVALLATCLFILLLLALNTSREYVQEPCPKVCMTEECVRTAASLLSAMDQTASPCVNFFQYACGAWNRMHVIPEDKSSTSTFEVLADQLQVILRRILEEPPNDDDNDATLKAKMFYKSCMDIPRIREIGDAPLRSALKRLGGWPVVVGPTWKPPLYPVEVLLGRLRGEYNEGVLMEQRVGPDDENSSANILQLDQMQLALPSRDYYLKRNSETELNAYHRYMTNVALLLNANPETAAEEFRHVIGLEKQLANASLPEADRHDTSAIYRKLTLRELQREIPEIKWRVYLQEFISAPITDEEPIVVYGMPYFVEMGRIVHRTDPRILHNYILWRLVMSIMPYMIDEYQQKRIEFRRILQGILSERHRSVQCVEWTNKKLGMAVGALFIRDNFNHESKETALEMIHTIREAFNELLDENHWMDDETRAVAKTKADSMNERIGYPEFLKDPAELSKEYLMLSITEDHFLDNILALLKYDAYDNIQNLRKPVDKDKWPTEPAVVNAFYNPNKNDIVFPAGILQPLFYSQHFPKSLNYGGIGVVIGHEITHGFDDKGRQFDKDGNMMQWWNNVTIRAFRQRAQCIVDQYSRYKLQDVGLYINGKMTQGENIADNGGLKQSFRAYKKWVSTHGEEPLLPGVNLTHDQLFFLNYAQIWCGSMRPEDALTKIRSSVHSPGPIRVWGPLSNSEDFARAYDCPPGSPMNPMHKCSVW
ncbi:neprilysin-1-like isoform X2 [Colletes gigas]|uniref:neprilysin-1-like isoform X1 n=1 Tax=Colletes gigas TaxID=935657 RepID=UPI001C9B9332|nr:neprilysin-1-like isoform X1 [Colletes gigas]XP_043262155.1 neprilysin-1-like isoform X1 [Colletes gigas]XP_043262156.1 neprilysin-1-like isoform X2 [Colletes gigas]